MTARSMRGTQKEKKGIINEMREKWGWMRRTPLAEGRETISVKQQDLHDRKLGRQALEHSIRMRLAPCRMRFLVGVFKMLSMKILREAGRGRGEISYCSSDLIS